MAEKFLGSTEITIYPTSYRSKNAGDIESCIMTERNLTFLKKLSKFSELNNYFDCKDASAPFNFDLVLSGYHFYFKLTSNFLGDFTDKVYAYVFYSNKIDASTTSGIYALAPNVDDDKYIDILDSNIEQSSTSSFMGLTFNDALPDGIPSSDYIQLLEKVDGSWKVCKNRDLKISTVEIQNGITTNYNNAKNITEQFDSANISITTTATINQAFIKTIGSSATTTYSEGRVENIFASTINSTSATIGNMTVTSTATLANANVTTSATINQAFIKTIGANTTATYTSGKVENIYSKTITSDTINVGIINATNIYNVTNLGSSSTYVGTAYINNENVTTSTIGTLYVTSVIGATNNRVPTVYATSVNSTNLNIATTATINGATITNANITSTATINNASITKITNTPEINGITISSGKNVYVSGSTLDRLVPSYSSTSSYSVLGVVNTSLTWISSYDGAYTSTIPSS